MEYQYCVFIIAIIFGNTAALTIGDGCVTTDGSNGTCLRIKDCPKYSALLSESAIPQNVRDILKKATCGLSDDKKPLLCCPMETIVQTSQVNLGEICITPDGERGLCITLEGCPKYSSSMVGLTSIQTVNYLKKANCGTSGENKPMYCCPGGREGCQVEEPSGYELYSGVGNYKLYTVSEDFQTAAQICWKERAHLAIVNSKEEEDALVKLLNKYGDIHAWVGVHDPKRDRIFRTIYGTPLFKLGYTNWGKGEPNGVGKEHCVEIENEGFLNDKSCEDKNEFICEYPL